MRLPGSILLISTLASPGWCDGLAGLSTESLLQTYSDVADYRLGGAARRQALLPPSPAGDGETETRLSAFEFRQASETRRVTRIGDVTVYYDDGWDLGRDAFHLGTSMTRGAATAGVSVTYLDDGSTMSRSELYLDYSLSKRLRVGFSGILDTDVAMGEAPVPQLGVNAEYEPTSNTYLHGGFADAPETVTVFGLSIGLRF